jgi:hypothetical protein
MIPNLLLAEDLAVVVRLVQAVDQDFEVEEVAQVQDLTTGDGVPASVAEDLVQGHLVAVHLLMQAVAVEKASSSPHQHQRT